MIPNFARVRCHEDCGLVELTPLDYDYQMARASSKWYCPKCTSGASFDDEFFEDHCDLMQEGDGP